MNRAMEILERQRIVPIVRVNTVDEARRMVDAIFAGGMQMVELTMTIPRIYDLISQLRKSYAKGIFSVGTIRDGQMAQNAIDAGAELLVTYKPSKAIAEVGKRSAVPYILGGMTPTEIDQCLELESSLIKLFPASIVGPNTVRTLKGPLPDAKFFPTGGITLDSIDTWLDAGASAVGIGSSLLTGDTVAITERVTDIMNRFSLKSEGG